MDSTKRKRESLSSLPSSSPIEKPTKRRLEVQSTPEWDPTTNVPSPLPRATSNQEDNHALTPPPPPAVPTGDISVQNFLVRGDNPLQYISSLEFNHGIQVKVENRYGVTILQGVTTAGNSILLEVSSSSSGRLDPIPPPNQWHTTLALNVPWSVDLSLFKHTEVLKVQRSTTKKRGQARETPHVQIIWKQDPPPFVSANNLTFRLENLSHLPPRCYRCQCYGHKVPRCQGRLRCAICAEGHDTRYCPERDNPFPNYKCANCLGPHSAGARRCPQWKHRCQGITQNQGKERSNPNVQALMDITVSPSEALKARLDQATVATIINPIATTEELALTAMNFPTLSSLRLPTRSVDQTPPMEVSPHSSDPTTPVHADTESPASPTHIPIQVPCLEPPHIPLIGPTIPHQEVHHTLINLGVEPCHIESGTLTPSTPNTVQSPSSEQLKSPIEDPIVPHQETQHGPIEPTSEASQTSISTQTMPMDIPAFMEDSARTRPRPFKPREKAVHSKLDSLLKQLDSATSLNLDQLLPLLANTARYAFARGLVEIPPNLTKSKRSIQSRKSADNFTLYLPHNHV